MSSEQILGLDVGQRRLGVARAHLKARLVEPLSIIDLKQVDWLQDFQALLDEYQPQSLVIGIPFDKNGQLGSQALTIKQWVLKLLEQTQYKGQIIYWDETLSSQQVLKQKPLKSKFIDDQAAAVILDDYLQSLRV